LGGAARADGAGHTRKRVRSVTFDALYPKMCSGSPCSFVGPGLPGHDGRPAVRAGPDLQEWHAPSGASGYLRHGRGVRRSTRDAPNPCRRSSSVGPGLPGHVGRPNVRTGPDLQECHVPSGPTGMPHHAGPPVVAVSGVDSRATAGSRGDGAGFGLVLVEQGVEVGGHLGLSVDEVGGFSWILFEVEQLLGG